MEVNRFDTQWNGNLNVNGDIHASNVIGNIVNTSDQRLKKKITPIHQSLKKINQLQGVNFFWNTLANRDTTALQTGFIAQEIEKIFPEMVSEGADGYKQVNYIEVIPHLVEALKELKLQNDRLKAMNLKQAQVSREQIAALEDRLAALEKLIMSAANAKSN